MTSKNKYRSQISNNLEWDLIVKQSHRENLERVIENFHFSLNIIKYPNPQPSSFWVQKLNDRREYPSIEDEPYSHDIYCMMTEEKKYICKCLSQIVSIDLDNLNHDEWDKLNDDEMVIYFLSEDHNVYKVSCGFGCGDASSEIMKEYIDIEQFRQKMERYDDRPIDNQVFRKNNIYNIQDLLGSSVKNILKSMNINKHSRKYILKIIREIKDGLRANEYKKIPSQWDHKVSEFSYDIKTSDCWFDIDCITYTRKNSHHEGLILTTWEDAQEVLSKQEHVLLNYKLIKEYIVFGYVRNVADNLDIPEYLTRIVQSYFC